MTTKPIRYGIVGCAGMGQAHADSLEHVEGAELVACADISEDIAQSFGSTYECEPYTDHAKMFDEASIDAVSICTPNGSHADIVVSAADHGVHVLCEKPLDVTPERVDQLIEACREAGVILGGIFQRRTLPAMRFARDVVRSGDIGRLLLADVRVTWYRGNAYFDDIAWHGTADLDGGVLLTQALHGIDLLQWIAGDVESVTGSLETLHHDIEVPDTAALNLELTNGALGQVSATTATQPSDPITLRFHGTEGSLCVREGGIDAYETNDGPVDFTVSDPPAGGGHAEQLRDFVAAIVEERQPMVPPEEARKALDIVFAAEAFDRRGESVPVSDISDSTTE